jgi:hypothetical protein
MLEQGPRISLAERAAGKISRRLGLGERIWLRLS